MHDTQERPRMVAKVYYWKDVKYLTQKTFDDVNPTTEEFKRDYTHVATLVNHDQEAIFEIMNINPEAHRLPTITWREVGHTSMSVGDIIIFNDEVAAICADIGFDTIHFEPEKEGANV